MSLSAPTNVQDAATETDLWARLLGVDRVRIEGDWSITWQHMPETWVLFLVVLPLVAAAAFAFYRKERQDVGVAPKAVLATLRGLLLLLVLLLLMGPVLTVETIKKKKASLIVLVDESRSMQKTDLLQSEADRKAVAKVTGVADEAGLRQLTRADVVRKVLENPKLALLDELEKKLNVAYYTFSSSTASKDSKEKLLEDYRRETCVGTETAIGDAVKAALNSQRGQYVAGVVIFSDGRTNAGMASKEIAAQLRQRYLPIYTVAPGVPHTPKDIMLLELEGRDAVLANDIMKIAFKVSSFGYENESVNVGLWVHPLKDGDLEPAQDVQEIEKRVGESRKEAEVPVTLSSATSKQPLTLDWTPKTPGEYLLILRVDPRAEENTDRNNYLTHRVRVADDKIKVLYLEHPPRYEYRFLKNSLIRDPKILTHCLLTSADDNFPQEHTKSEDPLFREPLKEFPKDLKSLLEFDVVIYGDVAPEKLGPDGAKHLEQFVTEFGGGIIFISGTLHNPRSLANTPLANLLPAVPEESRDLYAHEKVWVQHLDYQLTPDGRTSPITNFKDFKNDRDRNQEHWEDRAPPKDGLLGIRWYTRVKKLKAGASPLVELVNAPGETARQPLFVTMHAGRGRVFWSATDETWLWRRLAGDYPWFYPFWQQAMYWVREGKLLGARRYWVNVDKERYSRGEPVKVFARAYDEKFEHRTEPTLDVYVDPPSGRAGLERLKVTLLKVQARDGYYEGHYRPDDTGLYRIWAGDEDESTRSTAKFTVFIPDREDDDPILDVTALKEMAEESYNGRFFPVDEVDQLGKVIQESKNQLRETREDDLWDSPLVYLVFSVIIAAEWILRKLYRML